MLRSTQHHARTPKASNSAVGTAERSPPRASSLVIAEQDDIGQTPIASLLRIQADTAKPIYQQLEEQLVALIENGRIRIGTILPAEKQLAKIMGIGRGTIQRCYTTLRERRLIRAHGRNGSIVEGVGVPRLLRMDRINDFTQQMREMGRSPSSRILEREIVQDRQIASVFNLPSTAPLLKLVRIRCGDGIPLCYEKAWYSINAAHFLAQFDLTGSIPAQLAQDGVSLAFCDQTVEATFSNALESEIFGFKTPISSLLIKRRSYTSHRVMVEYVEGLFRGDAYTYRVRLTI